MTLSAKWDCPLDFLSPAHRRWLMSSSECSCLRFISLSKCDYYRHFNASDRLPVSLSFDCLSLLCGVLSVKAEPIVWIGWPFVKCNPSQPLIFGFARCKPMHSKRTQPSNCPQFPCIGKFIGVFARFWTADHLRNQQKRKIYLSAKLFDIHTHKLKQSCSRSHWTRLFWATTKSSRCVAKIVSSSLAFLHLHNSVHLNINNDNLFINLQHCHCELDRN